MIFVSIIFFMVGTAAIYFSFKETIHRKIYFWYFGTIFSYVMSILALWVISKSYKKIIFTDTYIEEKNKFGKSTKIFFNDIEGIEKVINPYSGTAYLVRSQKNGIGITSEYENFDHLFDNNLKQLFAAYQNKYEKKLEQNNNQEIICEYVKNTILGITGIIFFCGISIFICYPLLLKKIYWVSLIISSIFLFVDIFLIYSFYLNYRKYILTTHHIEIKDLLFTRIIKWINIRDIKYKYFGEENISDIILTDYNNKKYSITLNTLSNSTKLLSFTNKYLIIDKQKCEQRDKIKFNKKNKIALWFSIIFIISISIMSLYTAYKLYNRKQIEKKLNQNHLKISGKVISKNSGKYGNYIKYDFIINEKKYIGKSKISDKIYNERKIGSKIDIIYFKNNPRINEIEGYYNTYTFQIYIGPALLTIMLLYMFYTIKKNKKITN